MRIPFTKMSGAGNDFVVVDNRSGIINDAANFAVTVCNRRLGIGADGLLLVENHESSAFAMKYYNADGSNAGMCGNGGRCIAKFAYDNGIVSTSVFIFEGFGHIYTVEHLNATRYTLTMKTPHGYRKDQQLNINGEHLIASYLNTGTDHSVIFLDDNNGLGHLASAEVFRIGRAVRYNDVYKPLGVNANFVARIDAKSIQIRTYERGVEDETLACGTGSVASALLSSLKYGMTSPIKVKVQSGEFLEIGFRSNGESFSEVTLTGNAVNTFNGEFEYQK
ncbi:MAG: diaminopimelate epimerase [Bacteroidota bacterium]